MRFIYLLYRWRTYLRFLLHLSTLYAISLAVELSVYSLIFIHIVRIAFASLAYVSSTCRYCPYTYNGERPDNKCMPMYDKIRCNVTSEIASRVTFPKDYM